MDPMRQFLKFPSFSVVLKLLYLSAMVPLMLGPSTFRWVKVLLANFSD